MIPNTSWDRRVVTFPWAGSGRIKVSREPEAATICCSLVPENWPKTAWVIEVGGWMVSEYKNMFEVVAIFAKVAQKACAAVLYEGVQCALSFDDGSL